MIKQDKIQKISNDINNKTEKYIDDNINIDVNDNLNSSMDNQNVNKSNINNFLSMTIIILILLILFLTQNLQCVFYNITGLFCPGCGVTRMVLSLLRLDFYQAFRYNPLIFILLILSMFYIIYSLIRYKKIVKLNNKLLVLLTVLVVIYWILRNTFYFEFLAPTVI